MKRRSTVLIVVAILGSSILAAASLNFFAQYQPMSSEPSCGNPSAYGRPAGWSYVCGFSSVSDELLNITLNNYRYADGRYIQFYYDNNTVFLLVNVTIRNVGNGNAPITAGWYVLFQNRSSSIPTSTTTVFGNGLFLNNANFSQLYPSGSFPKVNGGVNLVPGQRYDVWLIFDVPSPHLTINSSALHQLVVSQLMYFQGGYSGQYQGGGGYICPCQTVDTELIVIPPP